MSIEWDVRCVTCGVDAGMGYDRGLDLIRALIRAAGALGDIAQLRRGDVEVAAWSSRIPVGWFAEHRGHQLRPVDEYGVLDGECGKITDCVSCGTLKTCIRADGHEGDCSPALGIADAAAVGVLAQQIIEATDESLDVLRRHNPRLLEALRAKVEAALARKEGA